MEEIRRSMNGNKHWLLLLAFAGIILWNTPDTASLLVDSHAFYNGSAPCSKCHGDVLAQLEDSGSVNAMHLNLDWGGGCRTCHSSANMSGGNASQDYHSAYSPYCIECHQNVSSISNNKEVHSLIVSGANSSSLNPGLNEACILCHTTITGEVVVRARAVFPFESDSVAANATAEYNGTYITTISNPQPVGLHNYNSGVQCIMCHAPVQDILGQPDAPPAHREFGCQGCHRGSGMVAGQTSENQTDYHAAKIKYCSDCHNLDVHPDPPVSRDCNLCHESHGGLKANNITGTEEFQAASVISPALINTTTGTEEFQGASIISPGSGPIRINPDKTISIGGKKTFPVLINRICNTHFENNAGVGPC
ncbi:MAG: hypothetical protein SCH70_12840, partial [Candidatus Methanoperedens sp.]|nr:hypothetical protein [Candidatus Methanoperedens sp.]